MEKTIIKPKSKKVSKPKEYGVDVIMLNVRLTVEERDEMQNQADKEFRTLSGFIRSRCLAPKQQ